MCVMGMKSCSSVAEFFCGNSTNNVVVSFCSSQTVMISIDRVDVIGRHGVASITLLLLVVGGGD